VWDRDLYFEKKNVFLDAFVNGLFSAPWKYLHVPLPEFHVRCEGTVARAYADASQ
jgi:hypothetical protein